MKRSLVLAALILGVSGCAIVPVPVAPGVYVGAPAPRIVYGPYYGSRGYYGGYRGRGYGYGYRGYH